MKKFLVQDRHGRIFRQVDPHTRILVAIPGQEISIELARELGLLDEPEEDVKVINDLEVTHVSTDTKPAKKQRFASYPPPVKRGK